MAKLGAPHLLISIPRLLIAVAILGAIIGSTQLTGATPKTQPIHSQTVSVKNSVPYTAAPQPITQPAPIQTPQTPTTSTVPKTVAQVVTVTHSTTTAPVITPSPAASVSGLTPVNPTSAPSSSSTSSGSGSGSTGSSTPTTSSYTSTNWSGYIATTGNYTAISGSWSVPKATGINGTESADATWIGIGGVSASDLIQVGTQNTVSRSGTETSSAFYELLPRSSRTITTLPIAPGDVMTASLSEVSTGEWKISITDVTTNQSYVSTVAYASSNSSAEWIEEDPSITSGHLIPLDTFYPVAFSDTTAVSKGSTVTLSSGDAQPVTMVTESKATIATPSAIGSEGDSFTVTIQS